MNKSDIASIASRGSATKIDDMNAFMVRLEVGDADVAEMNTLLRRGMRVANEQYDRDRHLYEMIIKPWGREYRAYADDFLDVWHLQINAGHATSMHAHPRKVTYLLCLSGRGLTTTLTHSVEVRPGSVLRIARGVFHSTENTGDDPLMLIEVETPRNKYDLIRLRDGYQREGAGYEKASIYLDAQPRKITYLPNAKMCRTSPDGRFEFNIYSGMDVHYRRSSAGDFLIPLGIRQVLVEEMCILTNGSGDSQAPELDTYYLSVRRVEQVNITSRKTFDQGAEQ